MTSQEIMETKSPENKISSETETHNKPNVIVCVYPEHEDIMEKMWRQNYSGDILFRTVKPEYNLKELLAELIADVEIADDFVLLQPDTVPCASVSLDELRSPVVYITATGVKKYDEKMPMVISKDTIVPLLADDKMSSEDIVRNLLKAGTRPLEVGFSFGNYVTPVRRGNPCEHIVIEALVRKKFIIASLEGFDAIRHLLLMR